MSEKIPLYQEKITNLDDLKKDPLKFDQKTIDAIKAYLSQKWVDIKWNIINLSRTEIDELKKETDVSKIGDYIYNEALETKNENSWIDWVNLEALISANPDNSYRLENLKKDFESACDPMLDKYDFLDKKTKDLIKLAIVNRLVLNYQNFWWSLEKSFSEFANSLKDLEFNKMEETYDKFTSENSSPADMLKNMFLSTIKDYSTKFEEINSLETLKWFDAKQKQNIISNLEWFQNPNLMEKWANLIDLSKIDISKSNTENKLDLKKLKEYMEYSKSNLNTLNSTFKKWDESLNSILKICSWNWVLWSGASDLMKSILNIPILGKIFAMFLGLNSPSDFDTKVSDFKFGESLKSLWVTFDEKWNLKEKWFWVFENKDLSEVNYAWLSDNLKTFKEIYPELKQENYTDFLKKWFSSWIDISWVNLKFELDKTSLNKDKLETSDIKTAFENWIKNYKKALNEKKLQDQQKAFEEEQLKIKEDKAKAQANIDASIAQTKDLWKQIEDINLLISAKYKEIPNWDNLVFDGINDIKVSDLHKKSADELLKETLEDDYNSLKEEDKILLKNLFATIIEFLKIHPIDVKDYSIEKFLELNSKQFNELLESKKKTLEEKQKEEYKKQQELNWEKKLIEDNKTPKMLAHEINKKIESCTSWNLVDWITLDDWTKICLNPDSQEFFVWEIKYKMSLMSKIWETKITNIVFNENNKVEFQTDVKVLFTNLSKELTKKEIQTAITDVITKWKWEFKWDDTSLKIEKV